MEKLQQRMIVHFVDYDINGDARYDIMTLRGDDITIKQAVDAVKQLNGYAPVAAVEYDDRHSLEDNFETVFKIMQNGVITDSWTLSPPDGLQALVDPIDYKGMPYGHRSISVGDLIEFGGNQYVVASFGFKKVN